jgi:hypothetical protein
LRHEVAICTAGRRRKRRSSHDVVSSVSALRGRHWQRWGLKHAVAVGPVSRTRERLWGMKGMDNGSEALTLRIVTSAELKRHKGSRPKKGRGPSAGDFNARPPHVACPPVYRGVLTPAVHIAKRGKPDLLSGQVQGRQTWSRPTAREGNGGAGKGRGRKRRPSGNRADRGRRIA